MMMMRPETLQHPSQYHPQHLADLAGRWHQTRTRARAPIETESATLAAAAAAVVCALVAVVVSLSSTTGGSSGSIPPSTRPCVQLDAVSRGTVPVRWR